MLFPSLLQIFTSEDGMRASTIYYHLQKGERKDMEDTHLCVNLQKKNE